MAIDLRLLAIGLAGLAAGITTALLLPAMERLAYRTRAVDVPGPRRRHGKATPRLGGVAIIAGVAIGTSVGLPIGGVEFHDLGIEALSLIAALAGIFGLGVVDDLRGLGPTTKLAGQTACALVLVLGGWRLAPSTAAALQPESLATAALTLLWVLGVTNSINFLDGLDGLASGSVALIGLGFLSCFYLDPKLHPVVLPLTSALVASCLAFLPRNRWPATIFMGDAGSLSLGFILAAISVRATVHSPAAVAPLAPLLMLAVPVLDTLFVISGRWTEDSTAPLRGRLARLLRGDRNHLHHRLREADLSPRGAVRLIWALVGTSCLGAVAVAYSGNSSLGLTLLALLGTGLHLLRRAPRLASPERRPGPGPAATGPAPRPDQAARPEPPADPARGRQAG